MHELHVPLHLSRDETDMRIYEGTEQAFASNWFAAIVNDITRRFSSNFSCRLICSTFSRVYFLNFLNSNFIKIICLSSNWFIVHVRFQNRILFVILCDVYNKCKTLITIVSNKTTLLFAIISSRWTVRAWLSRNLLMF